MNTNANSGMPSMFKMTWPIFVETLLQMLVGYVDQFMISRYNEDMVGAMTNANQLINIIILVFGVVSTASTILIAQYLGAENHGKVKEISTLAIAMDIAIGLVISLAVFLLADELAVWFSIPPNMTEFFIEYTRIVGGFMTVQAVFLGFSAFFKSNGLMSYTMIFALVMNAVNIVGNWFFIYGKGPFPEMGIRGAAIATISSKIIGLVLIIIVYCHKIKIPISPKMLVPFPKDMFLRIVKIGVPAAGENISYDMSQLVILIFVNWLGSVEVTTRSYGYMFSWLCCIFTMSVGNALRIMVGYLIGAGRHDDATKVIKKSLIASMLISVGTTLIILTFSDAFYGIFTDNPEILVLGKQILYAEIALEIGRTINVIMVSSLQAAGDIKFPVMLGIISNWSVAALLSYIFGIVFGWGLVGIWAAMATDECLRGIIYLFRFRSGVWRKKNIMS